MVFGKYAEEETEEDIKTDVNAQPQALIEKTRVTDRHSDRGEECKWHGDTVCAQQTSRPPTCLLSSLFCPSNLRDLACSFLHSSSTAEAPESHS